MYCSTPILQFCMVRASLLFRNICKLPHIFPTQTNTARSQLIPNLFPFVWSLTFRISLRPPHTSIFELISEHRLLVALDSSKYLLSVLKLGSKTVLSHLVQFTTRTDLVWLNYYFIWIISSLLQGESHQDRMV